MNLDLILSTLAFACIIYLLLPLRGMKPMMRLMILLGLLVVGLVPVNELPLASYLRALVDDLAVTTLVFLTVGALRHTVQSADVEKPVPGAPQARIAPLAFFAVVGLALYPATLGLSAIDPYRLGYQPDLLLILGGIAALAFCYWHRYVAAVALVLGTLAFQLGLYNSNNYWDYIIDPALAIYALVVSVRWAVAAGSIRMRQLRAQEAVQPVRQS